MTDVYPATGLRIGQPLVLNASHSKPSFPAWAVEAMYCGTTNMSPWFTLSFIRALPLWSTTWIWASPLVTYTIVCPCIDQSGLNIAFCPYKIWDSLNVKESTIRFLCFTFRVPHVDMVYTIHWLFFTLHPVGILTYNEVVYTYRLIIFSPIKHKWNTKYDIKGRKLMKPGSLLIPKNLTIFNDLFKFNLKLSENWKGTCHVKIYYETQIGPYTNFESKIEHLCNIKRQWSPFLDYFGSKLYNFLNNGTKLNN